jgi:hypothetical protein
LTGTNRQGNMTDMEIAASAHRHDIADDDMLHAITHPLVFIEQDETRVFVIGAARDGRPLEVVVLDPEGDPLLIHAANLRPKFYRYLR